MIILVNYADANMTRSQRLCSDSAVKHGVDKVWQQNPDTIDLGFKEFNKEILSAERGAGFWLWKPYFIYKSMLQMEDGDMLIYADSGVEFINGVHHVIDRMDESIFLFTNTHPNHHWTKRETLAAMGYGVAYDKDYSWPQVQASVIFIKVCDEMRIFVKTWLMWSQIPGMINDDKCLEQYPYFQDHRHDQSIITILATGAKYKLHWWPTAYAEHIRVSGDTYPVLFNHHRKRNNEWHNS